MPVHAEALPLPMELAGVEQWRQPVVRSGRGNGEFDQRKIRRDASAAYDQTGEHRRSERLAGILRRRRHPSSIALPIEIAA